MQTDNRSPRWRRLLWLAIPAALACLAIPVLSQSQSGPTKNQKGDAGKNDFRDRGKTSYDQINVPVLLGQESFATMKANSIDVGGRPAGRHGTR